MTRLLARSVAPILRCETPDLPAPVGKAMTEDMRGVEVALGYGILEVGPKVGAFLGDLL